MKKIITTILTLAILWLSAGFSITSDGFIEKLKRMVDHYNDIYPDEKVYIQTDKPFYKPGEDIWFNAFVVEGISNKATSTSDVLYVELIDPKGNVEKRHPLHITNGIVKGDFHLEETHPGGLYRLKAFTHWMKNFGPERIFEKELMVQKVITPRLLMNLDFEKKAHGAGDNIVAKLKVKDLRNMPLQNGTIDFTVRLAGKNVHQGLVHLSGKEEMLLNFQLPDDLNTADGLLNVIVQSGGVSESISRSIPIVFNKISLQFFPEGGDMILAKQGQVAFKALNEFGKAADVSGVIIDDKDNIVQGFESYHMGMGAFTMTPQSGKRYFARIDKPQGITEKYELPIAKVTGYLLNVRHHSKDDVVFTIQSPRKEECYLISQSRGLIQRAEKIKLEEGMNEYKVTVKDFQPGVAMFTLFDGNGVEQCERLIFVNKHKGMKLNVSTDKSYYEPGEKVNVKIRAVDEQGKPLRASLSLAAVDDQLLSFANDKQDNILSSLLLSSDLKGEIEEPSFYFKEGEPKAELGLDYVMLTHGWRRFTWSEVMEPQQTISFAAEKINDLSGYVANKTKGETKEMTVTLLELGNKRRFSSVRTGPNGSFLFKNIDPTVPILLLSDIPRRNVDKWEVVIDENNPYAKRGTRGLASDDESKGKDNPIIPAEIVEEVQLEDVNIPAVDGASKDEDIESSVMDVTLADDVQALSEVVVVGYGSEEANRLTASVSVIEEENLRIFPVTSITQMLQGRVAGVEVTPQTGPPGTNAAIRIRGSSTLSGNNDPLVVVDGVPLASSVSYNFSEAGFLSPMDVESITVLKSAEASSLYGCMAANGVILITTVDDSNWRWSSSVWQRTSRRYASLQVQPRDYYVGREFYVQPVSRKKKQDERNDYRTTVYWNASVQTDEKGEAEVSFINSDATSAFRITTEGIGTQGLVGWSEHVYYTQLPLSVDVKIPEFLSFDDTVHLPIRVKNIAHEDITARMKISIPDGIKILSPLPSIINVVAESTETVWMTFVPMERNGKFPITINVGHGKISDEVTHEIIVRSTGFPSTASYSSQEMDKSIRFNINDPRKGSVEAEFLAYPNILGELMDGVESIVREPHGCFEQVSSSTFPNILVLQFMKETGAVNPVIEKKALNYIANGYRRLVGYEVKDGGFDWFGSPPANEALTAYGLFEFTEMKKVYSHVSSAMVNRTREWLLSRRAGDSTFRRSSIRYYHQDDDLMNAYIVFAMAESGVTEIIKEYEHALRRAIQSNDYYRLGLMANAAHALGRISDYQMLIDNFRTKVKQRGLDNLPAERSFTYSYGYSLKVEVLSLWGMALLKEGRSEFQMIDDIAKRVMSLRSFGGFGSTQGTILALKMLTRYAQIINSARDDGEVDLYVNEALVGSLQYTRASQERLTIPGVEKYLAAGNQNIRITYKNTTSPLPYAVNVKWNSNTPNSHEDCKLAIDVKLSANKVKLNETVRISTQLKNKTQEVLPMSMAIIGIPAGLSLQPWQLKEMQEKGVFDFYEVMDNYLVLYYRGMNPGEQRTINIDLKAEIPGTYRGQASSAYLYYANESKDWVEGKVVTILR